MYDDYGDNSFAAGPGRPIFELYVRCDDGEGGA